MKSILFTLVLLLAIGLTACRKDKNYPDIKTYDQQQIASYIAANGLTGMVKDTSGQDTTGIWYKIITPGTGAAVDYPDEISFVYTMKSFDGLNNSTDTVINHFDGLLGHLAPNGLILSIRNILKYKGGKMRVLIPSHLAYGVNGVSSGGSKTITSGRIAGNQCLDYTIELIDKQYVYDDIVIQKYMAANSLSGYTKITTGIDSGMYYKITTQGTGAAITLNSSITVNVVGELMNNTVFVNDVGTTTLSFPDLTTATQGVLSGLLMSKGGGGISLLVPSRLAYGPGGSSNGIPSNACLRFDITNIVVNQ